MRVLLAFIFLTFPAFALAIPEKNFDRIYEAEVLPYFRSAGQSGQLIGSGGKVHISYYKIELEQERGAVLILPGRGEPYAKYDEVAYDLTHQGYSVYLMDYRGQGYSDRLVKSDPQRGYVRDFDDYVEDLRIYYTTIVSAKPHAKKFVLAHSTGGLVAALYTQKYGSDFDAIAMSAPMFELNTDPYRESIARAIVTFNSMIGLHKRYAPGQGPFNPDARFEDNDLTQSEVRFRKYRKQLADHPQLIVGGATNGWLMTAFHEMDEAREQAQQVQVPVLILQAGSDTVVRNSGQEYFCSRAPHCRIVRFPSSRHEILVEKDAVRDPAMADILSFFATY